jgi:hypothetical protein
MSLPGSIDRQAGLLIDPPGPVDGIDIGIGEHGLPIGALEGVEETVARRMGDQLARLTSDLALRRRRRFAGRALEVGRRPTRQHKARCAIEAPGVADGVASGWRGPIRVSSRAESILARKSAVPKSGTAPAQSWSTFFRTPTASPLPSETSARPTGGFQQKLHRNRKGGAAGCIGPRPRHSPRRNSGIECRGARRPTGPRSEARSALVATEVGGGQHLACRPRRPR